MIRRLFKFLVIFSVLTSILYADSIWDNARSPFYGVSRRKIRVGDVITVFISESTSAVQSASTSTRKDSQVGTEMLNNWDQVANLLGNETLRKTFQFELNGNDEYQGTGATSRTSKVKAVVTATVTEILNSGNLFIVGEHHVKVNNEVETIRVSGIIRPQGISPKNSVFSYQIAKAEVSVNGSGVVGSKQTPGVMTKMFNWLF